MHYHNYDLVLKHFLMIFLIEELQTISQYRFYNDVIILYICGIPHAIILLFLLLFLWIFGSTLVYCYRMSFLKLYEQSVINFTITSLHSMDVIYWFWHDLYVLKHDNSVEKASSWVRCSILQACVNSIIKLPSIL